MSFDYVKMQETASRLLEKFGYSITVQVLTGQSYDPVLMSKTLDFTDSIGFGVTVPIKNSEADGSLILMSDIKLIIENISLSPTVGSFVTTKGTKYRVESVMPLNPAETNLIYTCILRK